MPAGTGPPCPQVCLTDTDAARSPEDLASDNEVKMFGCDKMGIEGDGDPRPSPSTSVAPSSTSPDVDAHAKLMQRKDTTQLEAEVP